MHISLDSAIGQQRRLNQVGETINSIAAPAAAYSLRSLTGGDPKVVRVRRESDNTERDFTASGVSSGAMVDFVNTQTIKPLDTRALNSGGSGERDGDFQIASAAYSLRSLGDRQATVSATGDTVTAANGKYVVQVRRSSDDTIKSFTADEVTDGTLVAFVGSGNDGFVRTWYDQSVTDQGGGTATGNHATQTTAAEQPKIVSSGSLVVDSSNNPAIIGDGTDDTLANATLTDQLDNSDFLVIAAYENAMAMGLSGAIPRMYLTSSSMSYNTNRTITYTIATGQKIISFQTVGDTQEVFSNGASVGTASQSQVSFGSNEFNLLRGGSDFSSQPISEVIVYASNQTDNRGAYEGNIADHYNITGVPTGANTVNGFVETWYDQSGNSRPLIQTSATEQPLIVENGVFLNGVKANEATSNSTMQNLQVSTDGTNANFGTDDWASGASSKLGLIYVGTVVDVVNAGNDAIIWGGGRGVSSYQSGGLSLQVIKGGTDSWKLTNERQGLSPSKITNAFSFNSDNDIVLYGIADNRDFTINVNGSGDTETESADLDVRENAALSLFGAYAGDGGRYYQRSGGGVCKECYLYAGTSITSIPTIATKINEHYSIY